MLEGPGVFAVKLVAKCGGCTVSAVASLGRRRWLCLAVYEWNLYGLVSEGPGEQDADGRLGRYQVRKEQLLCPGMGLWKVYPLSVMKNLFCTQQ